MVKDYDISAYGLGTTLFWSGSNPGLSACIREAVDRFGISVLDTAEMYGYGRSEEALGKTIRELPREKLFLVDKILPDNANEQQFQKSLHTSLKRLKVDYIDLFLLHWREDADLSFVVSAMEGAVKEGLIRQWGVSNFDTHDLLDLFAIPDGNHCFCNQMNFFSADCLKARHPADVLLFSGFTLPSASGYSSEPGGNGSVYKCWRLTGSTDAAVEC